MTTRADFCLIGRRTGVAVDSPEPAGDVTPVRILTEPTGSILEEEGGGRKKVIM
jgi:hypothetical protein